MSGYDINGAPAWLAGSRWDNQHTEPGVVTPAEYLAQVCSLASKQHASSSEQLDPRQQPAFALSTEALAVLGAVSGSPLDPHRCTPT
eukprot:SAG25_NODE_2904_length_1324_cov_1.503673_1_plen_87_part_00